MTEKYSDAGLAKLLDLIVEESNLENRADAEYPEDHWRMLMIEGRQLDNREVWVLMTYTMERARFCLARHQLVRGYQISQPNADEIYIPYIGADERTKCFVAHDQAHPKK